MNRYQNGKIYKFVNSVDDRIYIGSTSMPLSKRLYKHKQDAKKYTTQRVYVALNAIGWENVRIVLIEEAKCENKNQLISREQYYIDLLKPSLNKYAASGQRCEHNRRRSTCKDCGGSSICEHNRIRNTCKDCGGSQICEHNRQRIQCKDCGGSQICEHQRLRSQCKDCGGSSICEHNRERSRCKDCGGSQICLHNKQRNQCVECNPAICDLCNITTSKAQFNKHLKTEKHKKNER